METKVNIIICTIVLCILNISCTSAQGLKDPSFSTVFIDENAGNSKFEPKDQPTMGSIEDVLGSDHKDSEQALKRLSDYLKPIFIELERTDALRQISVAFSLKYEAIAPDDKTNRIDFLALVPLLDSIEHNKNKKILEQLEDVWPDSLRGFALTSLVSALRFGSCVELELKLINREQVDLDELCERLDYGRITDWHYDEKTGTGKFSLKNMKIDVYELSLNPTTNEVKYKLVKQWSNNWQVSIDSPGYSQAKRMDINEYISKIGSDPDVDPFKWAGGAPVGPPGVVNLPSLPAAAKSIEDLDNPPDGKVDGAIWPDQRDLNYRLFAGGLSVRVTDIEETLYEMQDAPTSGAANNYTDPIENLDYVRVGIIQGPTILQPNDPQMLSSTDSCVDIMFNLTNGFPATINDHPFSSAMPDEELGWCLGRCPQPVIQNSK